MRSSQEKHQWVHPVDYEAFCKATCQKYSQSALRGNAGAALRIGLFPISSAAANRPPRGPARRRSEHARNDTLINNSAQNGSPRRYFRRLRAFLGRMREGPRKAALAGFSAYAEEQAPPRKSISKARTGIPLITFIGIYTYCVNDTGHGRRARERKFRSHYMPIRRRAADASTPGNTITCHMVYEPTPVSTPRRRGGLTLRSFVHRAPSMGPKSPEGRAGTAVALCVAGKGIGIAK